MIVYKKKKNYSKSAKFSITYSPGERFAVDLMDLEKKYKAIIGIDFFSWKVFGQLINSKDSQKILKYLKDVYAKFPFKILQTDGGKEFENKLIREWTQLNKIKHEIITPHYHAANGRVERDIRTLRESMKKTKGSYKQKINQIIDSYNNLIHRGLGMTPNQGLLEENHKVILNNSFKYAKEFKKGVFPEFKINDKVIIKNENKLDKMDD